MTPQLHQSAVLAIQQAVFSNKSHRSGKKPPAVTATTEAAEDEIRLALNALQLHSLQQGGKGDRVARTACGALQDLLLTDQDRRAALEANAVPILAMALLLHGASLAVMTSSLSALLQLVGIDRAQAQLLRRDLLPPLVSAMRQHKAQGDVMALSLALLVHLSTTLKGRLLLFAAHAAEFGMDAMLTHPKNATIQCLGCELIHHMAEGSAAQQRLLELGAVEMVVEAVRRFPQERKLLQRALPTLCRMCEADQTRTAMGQVGGVAAILHAVNWNFEDPVIARYGCTLLWELTLCAVVRQQIVSMNVWALVRKVLSHHASRRGADLTLPSSKVEGCRA